MVRLPCAVHDNLQAYFTPLDVDSNRNPLCFASASGWHAIRQRTKLQRLLHDRGPSRNVGLHALRLPPAPGHRGCAARHVHRTAPRCRVMLPMSQKRTQTPVPEQFFLFLRQLRAWQSKMIHPRTLWGRGSWLNQWLGLAVGPGQKCCAMLYVRSPNSNGLRWSGRLCGSERISTLRPVCKNPPCIVNRGARSTSPQT